MEIQVTNLKGRKIKVELGDSDTLDDLKNKILDKEGVPLDKLRLVYGGVQLDDDGFVVDQIKAIRSKNFPNQRFSSSTFVNLHLVLRLRGGGNQVYHRPQGHSPLSDQSSDSDSDSPIPRKGPKVAADLNVVDAIGQKQVGIETGVHNLPMMDDDAGVEGLLDSLMKNLKKETDGVDAGFSCGNESMSDMRCKEENRVWRFLSGAGMSMNLLILMVAVAAFLVPKAMTKEFKVGVEVGGSIALSIFLSMVAAAFVFLAIRHGRLSLTLQRLKDDKRNMRLERSNQALKAIDKVLESQGRINKALESQGQMSWTQEEWFTRMEMLRFILRCKQTKGVFAQL